MKLPFVPGFESPCANGYGYRCPIKIVFFLYIVLSTEGLLPFLPLQEPTNKNQPCSSYELAKFCYQDTQDWLNLRIWQTEQLHNTIWLHQEILEYLTVYGGVTSTWKSRSLPPFMLLCMKTPLLAIHASAFAVVIKAKQRILMGRINLNPHKSAYK